jgi:hypothetical protein
MYLMYCDTKFHISWRRPSCCWLGLYLWHSRTVVEMKVQYIYTDPPTPITAFSASISTLAQVMAAMYLYSSCGSPFFSLGTFLCCLTCCYFLAHTVLPNFTVQWLALLLRIQEVVATNFCSGTKQIVVMHSPSGQVHILQSYSHSEMCNLRNWPRH